MSAVFEIGGRIPSAPGGLVFGSGSGGGSGPTPTLFISTTGNDSNNGQFPTQGSGVNGPWAITSLLGNSANQTAMAGKVIGLIAGTYATSAMNSTTSPGSFDTPVLTLPQGSSGNITTVVSCNSSGAYTQRVAILDNSSSTSGNPLIGQDPSHAGFWAIDGLTLKGNPTNAPAVFMVTGRYSFSTTGGTTFAATGITVQNCEIFNFHTVGNGGSNSGGIVLQGCLNSLVQNNYIHDIVATPDATSIEHCHGYEEFGSSGTIIQFNTFANCQGGAVDSKTGGSGFIVNNNYFYLCGTTDGSNGSGAVTGTDGAEGNPNTPGTTNQVHHNVFDSCQQEMSVDVNSTGREQSLNFFSNTVYNALSGSIPSIADMRQLTSTNSEFYNNIIVTTGATGSTTGHGLIVFSAGQFSPVNYNCYFVHSQNSMWGQGSSTSSTFSAWQSTAGSPDANSTTSNPTFSATITPANGPTQFQLGSGSPVISTGANPGRVGGTSGGATVNMGAWDGVVTKIGAAWVSYPVSLNGIRIRRWRFKRYKRQYRYLQPYGGKSYCYLQ
jgi:hypothetical protein